jgi:hypothetical protein
LVLAMVNAQIASDPLAYEIRRLSSVIISASERTRSEGAPAPGALATQLATTFGLRSIDVDIALTVLASQIDHEFGALLHTVAGRSELGILSALLPRLEDRLCFFDAVGADAPAVAARLVRRSEIEGHGVLTATRRFRSAVFGVHLLSALPSFAERIVTEGPRTPWVKTSPSLHDAMRERGGAICIVSGASGSGRTSWASNAARSVSSSALRIDAARAARADGNVSVELRELLEDSTLLGAAIVLDNVGELLGSNSRLATLIEEVVAIAPLRVFIVVDEVVAVDPRIASRALTHVRIEAPPAAARRDMWACARSGAPIPSTLEDLVLTPRQIRNAVILVEAGVDPVTAALEQISGSGLTMPNRTTSKLDALVLPADVRTEIVELIGAIRARAEVAKDVASGRGRAITAMFNGESGTGKTFACEVIAAEVGLPLMRVNVASLVDKYIGETEKNLVRVFAQAQGQGGILFFDEADAMFGARTDVSRAADRYANLETNLLLQLMESFTGVVLLTTNLKQNIDPAFMRRIMFKVYFEAPEPIERVKLWRTVLPSDRYEQGIDFGRLARTFELSGGSIRAAALRAAYRATAAQRAVSMADLAECAQLETHGMGRVATW